MKRFYKYIEYVLNGEVLVGEFIKLAVKRHLEDIKKSEGNYPYEFNPKLAQAAIKYFEIMRHWKGEWAGTRITFEPHQCFHHGLLYGWIEKKTKFRRFNTSLKLVARKNAKTTEAALRATYHLDMEGENGPQVYACATKEEQAGIVVNDTGQIIKRTPEIRHHFGFSVNRDRIHRVFRADKTGFLAALGSDSGTQDGFDPSYSIVDEYHAHPTDHMLNVSESGMAARRQPLTDVISTAGFNKEGPCYSQLRKTSINVLRGDAEDERLLPIIYELDEEDDWENEANWIKPNPNLEVSVKLDFLRSRYIKAKNEGGSKEVDFKTKNLNIWTDSAVTWIQDDLWMQNAERFEPQQHAKCFGGLDLAMSRDTVSFVCLFPVGQKFGIRMECFIPNDTLAERMEKESVNYHSWIRDGYLNATPGNVIDYNFVQSRILEYAERYDIKCIAYDRYNSTQLITNLMEVDVKCDPYVQGPITMNAPIRELEMLIREGRLMHGGNPVLRYMMRNVMLKMDSGGNVKYDKQKSTGRIDGVVSMAMAYGEYMTAEPSFRSRYEDNPEFDVMDL